MNELILQGGKRGYTIVELMVTVVIVAVLAATVGVLFVKLLNIQEDEREEAYIREKLVDICGIYADYLSVGSAVRTNDFETVVEYRQETGGVSLETGRVAHVSHLSTSLIDGAMRLRIFSPLQLNELNPQISNFIRSDSTLIPQKSDMISCSITPLRGISMEEVGEDSASTGGTPIGYLQVAARYKVRNAEGITETKTVKVGRVVRLWNWTVKR